MSIHLGRTLNTDVRGWVHQRLRLTLVSAIIGIVMVAMVTGCGLLRPRGPKALKPYAFSGYGIAASCTIQLPDGHGSVTYMHTLGDGTGGRGSEGTRAVRLQIKGGKSVDTPLMYYTPRNVRVGVYWYPNKSGRGPYVRFLDDCMESVVHIGTGDGFVLDRQGGRVLAQQWIGYEVWRNGRFVSSNQQFGSATVDMTSVFANAKSQHLGSIYRRGNTLVFVPAVQEAK